ncbi:MAG: hypothetical protein OXI79_14675 [Gammaproteobacteria bacterium]|nr:hypothetical protein [Gammaproteobacteria bacterium]
MDPTQEIVQQALAEGAVGHRHAVYVKSIDDGGGDRQTSREDRCPFGIDGFESDVGDVPFLQQMALQRRETVRRNAPLARQLEDRIVDGEDQTGRASKLAQGA